MQTITVDEKRICPGKIVCVGRNYVEHIHELNNEMPEEPVIFIKPNSAIAEELFTDISSSIHYESEICFLIKKEKIAGVGLGLDLTKRDLQSKLKSKGLPWERAKAFAGSATFSKFVSFTSDCSQLSMQLKINNQLVQQAGYDLMIHKPQALVDEITKDFSWQDGDLLMTGTPKGVGAVHRGDKLTASLFNGEELLLSHEWTANIR
jgi:2-keto-4-pentenoate hydratase/2-oxohepta-3-ene-1,7-dioic acid hydratase in catechol pathway